MKRLAVLFATLVLACGGSGTTSPPPPPPPPPPPAPVATVTVTLDSNNLLPGGSTSASAVTKDAAGNVLAGRAIAWNSTSPNVASVTNAGLISAAAAGTTNITATSEGQVGSALFTVLPVPVPVATVTVQLLQDPVTVGTVTSATATAKDAGGNVLPGRAVAWSSSNQAIATVAENGSITAVGPGIADITATIGGISGVAHQTVVPVLVATVTVALLTNPVLVGGTTSATATARDAGGNVLLGRLVQWTTSNAGIAAVTQAGLVTAITPGLVDIMATVEGIPGVAHLTVNAAPNPVVTVLVNLPSPIEVSQSAQAAAILKDAGGTVLSGRVTTWTSNHPEIATVSTSGLVSGVAIGAANIIALSEGKSGLATIHVVAPLTFGTGPKIVGVQIGAGLYRSNNFPSTSCFWERLSGFGGTSAETISNDFAGGPAVVAIAASDVGFSSNGCGAWVKVTGPITVSSTAPFDQGTFVVGTDVAPGTWQSSGSGSSCYWARLSGFGGTSAEIIANNFGNAPAVVTISASDQGFQSQGCGTWSKIG